MFTAPAGSTPNKDLIEKAIEYNESQRSRYDKLDKYYTGKHGINDRFKQPGLKNNQIVVNHAKYITDINVGYLIGNPVEYKMQEGDIEPVLQEYKEQNISDIDSELAKGASKFGHIYSLTYATEDNNVRTKTIDPRNCIIVYDDTVEHNKLFAITYKAKTTDKQYQDVYTYTDTEIQEWGVRLGATGPIKPHQFGIVPIVEYVNNPERIGDYEVVLSLIDAYNTIQSDRVNDKEQLVEAILVLYGMSITDEQKTDLRNHRVMTAPSKLEGAEVAYLTKQLNETDTDVLRASIEADIHKISMTPNLSDENFVGNASGVAIRYKLIGFEQSITNKERNFQRGLKERIVLYNNYLTKLKNAKEIEVYNVEVVFKRNLPQNDLETATMITYLDGVVDRETLVGELSFIENAKDTVAKARKEAQNRATALAEQFGTDQPLEGEA